MARFDNLDRLRQLRLLVAWLGEQHEGWWPTKVLTSTGDSYLKHNFPRTAHTAALNTVAAAARLHHDERVGNGETIHLFRLDPELESSLQQRSRAQDAEISWPASVESALADLAQLAGSDPVIGLGPTNLGSFKSFGEKTIEKFAAAYLHAFQMGKEVIPSQRLSGGA